jgi:hypothetical protein
VEARFKLYIVLVLMLSFALISKHAHAQIFRKKEEKKRLDLSFKLYQSTSGALVGYQRGKYNFFELGAEKNWRKIRLKGPKVYAVSGTVEYNLWDNILALRAAAWMRRGRFDFTYGLHGGYFTDFTNSNPGVGPAIGFKLLGFHGQLGYNYLIGKQKLEKANTLYLNLRYFSPLHTQLDVERKGKRSRLLKF